MNLTIPAHETPIAQGIKAVGVGKRGSKPLEPDLIRLIIQDIKDKKVSPIEQSAFFGALWMKGVTAEEKNLRDAFHTDVFADSKILVSVLCADSPHDIQGLCQELLDGKTLSVKAAHRLGNFFLSEEPGEGARGLAVSILRVRYESDDEYEGLLKSFQESLTPNFYLTPMQGESIIQIAEPFDGVDHSYLITPLLAKDLQLHTYRVVSLVGRNSGPKFGNNLLDLTHALDIPCARTNAELSKPKPSFGWYCDQKNMSPAMDHWVERRHKTIKRPCFATLEKFLNPVKAKIIITSAFHPPYGEKMTTIAERAGFQGSIVVRNGLEGTIAFPLKREVKLLCSSKQKSGNYLRHEITFDPAAFIKRDIPVEEILEQPSSTENARLIKTFAENGKTDNELFDLRVKATCHGIHLALEWITKHKETV